MNIQLQIEISKVLNTSIAILNRNNNMNYYNSFPLALIQLEEVKKIIKDLLVVKS
ncbi:MAG: hypothetical protein BroJett005_31050 [Ignavibacteriota bacterium]|nr:MAG: hypothetical protein BroJett005_31050 [Ignavibacteriota bacterium]